MLESLAAATGLPKAEVEILCSWNGGSDAEKEIVNRSGYEFLIAQRDPYHFASNMNQLAHYANGEVLAFVNDDVILDSGSLMQACPASSMRPPRCASEPCCARPMANYSTVAWVLTSTHAVSHR